MEGVKSSEKVKKMQVNDTDGRHEAVTMDYETVSA